MIQLNKVERNHIIKLISSIAKFIIKNFLFIIIILKPLYTEFGIYKSLLFGSIIILVVSIMYFIDWHNTIFYFEENSISYKKGTINVKKREIPFNKINTVDISQSMIQKLLDVYQIKIDTGSVIEEKSEIVLLLESSRASEIRNLLLEKNTDNIDEDTTNEYTLSSKDLLIYTLTSNVILSGMGIIFVIINFIDDYINEFLNINLIDRIIPSDNAVFKMVLIFILFVIFSIFIAIIRNYIKYDGFRVYIENDKLNIKYGMCNKKNYSFQRKKIKGIHIKQNFIMQKLNLRTIEVESIGYGDEEGEKAILYPICTEKLQKNIIEDLMPEFSFKGTINKPPKNSIFRFMIKKLIFAFIIICFLVYKFSYGYLSILLIPFVLVVGFLEYKNTAMGMSENLVYMCCNGFNRNQSIIKMSAVQSFEVSETYFQKLKGLSNYKINIFGNQFGNSIKVCNLSYRFYEKLAVDKFM